MASAAGEAYTKISLDDVEDSAVRFGYSELLEARFPQDALGAVATGLSHQRIKPGQRAFAHRHNDAEEIYVVIAGTGRINLDGEIVDLGPRDVIRVAPPVTRALEAGPDGLELIAFGPSHPGDADLVADFWTD